MNLPFDMLGSLRLLGYIWVLVMVSTEKIASLRIKMDDGLKDSLL